MKKVLIYMQRPLLKPTGGPTGYCYNLAKQLEAIQVSNIEFIESSEGDVSNFNNWVKNIKWTWLRTFVTIAKSFYKKWKLLYGRKHCSIVDLNSYDIVHFHSTHSMFAVRDSLKEYKGIVVLTSHSPTILSKEYFSYLTLWEQKHMAWFYKKLIRMDEYSFNRADYVFFPCEEAEEPYYNNWEYFGTYRKENASKIRYLLSGIEPCVAKKSREEIRNTYGIPDNAFVISYAGRHNELKGFDKLKNMGMELLKNENIYFLIAGKEEPIKGLAHPRWIEVGWTSDPHSLIAASDLFILPNRETYFDLIMLEVLSLGKLVLASHTGGNRFFEKIKPNGIFTYSTVPEAIDLVYKVMNMEKTEKEELEQLNKKMFYSKFTSRIFAENYKKLIESL